MTKAQLLRLIVKLLVNAAHHPVYIQKSEEDDYIIKCSTYDFDNAVRLEGAITGFTVVLYPHFGFEEKDGDSYVTFGLC